jgi:capsular polysaccharide export protein
VGLSALLHHVPVKVCGRAIYDIPNLTYSGRLKDFWREAPLHKPNPKTLQSFRSYLIEHTQLNGSVFKRLPVDDSRAGIVWNPSLSLLTHLTEKKAGVSRLHIHPKSNLLPDQKAGVSLARYAAVRERASRKRGNERHS